MGLLELGFIPSINYASTRMKVIFSELTVIERRIV
jgi:hypothetical protein